MRTTIKPLAVALLVGFLALGVNIVANIITNWLPQGTEYALSVIAALIVAAFSYYYVRSRQTVEVDIAVDALCTPEEEHEQAQRALVVFLSLYRPLRGPAAKLTQKQIDRAVRELDYTTLDLDNTGNTTLGHQIRAIKAHRTKLEHCWLVATKARVSGKRQSLDYAPVLAKYIQDKINPAIQVHYGENYAVTLDIEEKICRNTYRLVKHIYKEAETLGMKKKEIITDITGGIRGITLGAILACLDKDENVEYIGTDYDENGNPTETSYPVVVEYKPEPIEK
jgi:hypothetical protein